MDVHTNMPFSLLPAATGDGGKDGVGLGEDVRTRTGSEGHQQSYLLDQSIIFPVCGSVDGAWSRKSGRAGGHRRGGVMVVMMMVRAVGFPPAGNEVSGMRQSGRPTHLRANFLSHLAGGALPPSPPSLRSSSSASVSRWW
jgi:hypothetical protein